MKGYIWGTGEQAKKLNESICGEILGFLETRKTKDSFLEHPVFEPKEISKQQYDFIIVSSKSCYAIDLTAREIGIDKSKVIYFCKYSREAWEERAEWKKQILGKAYYRYLENQIKVQSSAQEEQDIMALSFMIKAGVNVSDGSYIDIGAHDGISFSNTKLFEDLGWQGICVEPNPDMYEKLCRNRRSINLNVAISKSDGVSRFTKVNGSSNMLSGLTETFSKEHKERVKRELKEMGGDIEEIEIQTRTLGGIIDEYFKDRKSINLVSIDVEGAEQAILESIDFDKYDIKLLIVEKNYEEAVIHSYMKERGYSVLPQSQDDYFYKYN